MNLKTDKELIHSYLEGNESALEIILERHKNTVYNFIYSKIKKEDLAEDIFQETFIKVILTLKKGNYSEEGKFISWVLRIAHNKVIDSFRLKKKARFISETSHKDDFSIFDVLSEQDLPYENKIINEQTKKELHDIISELPEDQRIIIDMRIFREYSFKEIAEELDISINTCLGRMRYALINLRKLIIQKNLILT
ncbi:MAG: sigma-70 family RNA polymerase sigma factor [Flavobacteriales bacterium]|nr:sigma-70 family RNA polymerase sigma factor [Flavobacteriales bacterium]